MAKNKTINIPEGNDFTLAFPMYLKDESGELTPLFVSAISSLEVDVELDETPIDKELYSVSFDTSNKILVSCCEKLEQGMYSVHISGKIGERDIASHLYNCFGIVEWNKDASYLNFIVGEEVKMPESAFIYSTTDIDELRKEYEKAIQELQEAKLEYLKAKEEFEQVNAIAKEETLVAIGNAGAKEETLSSARNAVLQAISAVKESALDDSDKQDIIHAISAVLSIVTSGAKESTAQETKSVVESNTDTLSSIKEMVEGIRQWEEDHVPTDEELKEYYGV